MTTPARPRRFSLLSVLATAALVALLATVALLAIPRLTSSSNANDKGVQTVQVAGGITVKIEMPQAAQTANPDNNTYPNVPVGISNLGAFDLVQHPICIPKGGTAILVGLFPGSPVNRYMTDSKPGTLNVTDLPLGTSVTVVYGYNSALVNQTVVNITDALKNSPTPILPVQS